MLTKRKSLHEKCIKQIASMEEIKPVRIRKEEARLDIEKSGVGFTETRQRFADAQQEFLLPNITAIASACRMPYQEVGEILIAANRWQDYVNNPQQFIEAVTAIINNAKLDVMMEDGVKYTRLDGQEYTWYEVFNFAEEKELTAFLDLKQAVGKYIEFNPASEDRMGDSRPISPVYSAKHYNIKQLKQLFEALKGDPFEFMYMLKAYYGLRRSELMGIKWDAVDFDTISINHSVVKSNHEGKRILDKKDKLKTKSSRRSYPLLPPFKAALLAEKDKQEKNKALYKSSYQTNDAEYVWVDDIGKLINPEKVSSHFKTILKQNNLPVIRLHDLRHSSASLLMAMEFNVKEIQAWLGHSAAKTTVDNQYGHAKNIIQSRSNSM